MKKNSMASKKVVCLGGGNAMPKAVLEGLKKYPVKISAICPMSDSGGSSGRLRKDYKILAPGDIRKAFIALANTSPIIKELFDYRFESGELQGHNFANLFIAALELSTNNYTGVIETLQKVLKVRHKVLPITIDKSELYARLENGQIIKGEAAVDKPKYDGCLRIEKIFLRPKAKIYPEARKELQRANCILIGPGDLYSTLGQILLVEGVKEAIKKSKAKTVYIVNLMTKYGETKDFSVSDFTKEIEKYLKRPLDFVIYNTKMPGKERLRAYRRSHPELLEMVKIDPEIRKSRKFIGLDLLKANGEIVHSPKKLAKVIIGLLKR